MKSGIMEFVPCWKCLECEHEESIEDTLVPQKCPKCGSDRIDSPPIKKDGDGKHPYIRY